MKYLKREKIVLNHQDNALLDAVANHIRRFRKFDVVSSIGAVQTNIAEAEKLIAKKIRPTDNMLVNDNGIYVVIYDYTDMEGAQVAFQRMVEAFDKLSGGKIVTLAAFTRIYDEDVTPESVLLRIDQILMDARKQEHSQAVDDRDYFARHNRFTVDFSDL